MNLSTNFRSHWGFHLGFSLKKFSFCLAEHSGDMIKRQQYMPGQKVTVTFGYFLSILLFFYLFMISALKFTCIIYYCEVLTSKTSIKLF